MNLSVKGHSPNEPKSESCQSLSTNMFEVQRDHDLKGDKIMLERLKKFLLEAPVFKRGEYKYFIHPIIDRVPEIKLDGRADRGA